VEIGDIGVDTEAPALRREERQRMPGVKIFGNELDTTVERLPFVDEDRAAPQRVSDHNRRQAIRSSVSQMPRMSAAIE